MTKKFKWEIAINIFLVVAVLFAFYLMYFRSEGLLQAKGIAAFKYFTVQSNVFGGLMAAVWLISAAFCNRGEARDVPRAVVLLKYTAAVCLGLTFVTVMVFLGPLYGYIAMLRKTVPLLCCQCCYMHWFISSTTLLWAGVMTRSDLTGMASCSGDGAWACSFS